MMQSKVQGHYGEGSVLILLFIYLISLLRLQGQG